MYGSQRAGPAFPPLYSDPVALTASRHAHWRLLPGGAAFAAGATSVPLVASEFAAASRSYPILFTGTKVTPVALLGLEKVNLFVDGERWAEGAYVPAYVRRYPFVMIEAADGSGFALAVDAASKLIGKEQGTEGASLFQDGRPAPVTLRGLEFCRQFTLEHERARGFCQGLQQADLLADRYAAATLPCGGRKLCVGGFKVVDPRRFSELPEQTVICWHRNGWLALVYFHLASLERCGDLLVRQGRKDGAGDTPVAGARSKRVLQ